MSIVWHFRLADPTFGLRQARECQNHISDSLENVYPIHAVLNSKNIEVRPRAISKAELARRLINDVEEDNKLVLCVGNERADEELFEMIKQLKQKDTKSVYITCSVGSKGTSADYFATGVGEVLNVLNKLAEK
jgi:trehalose-phosphatase